MAFGRKCSPIPSPHQSPVSLPEPAKLPLMYSDYGDHRYKIHLLQVVMIAIASTVGVIFLLFVVLKILGNYYSRRYYNRRRNSPILFDIHGDSPFSDDEGTEITYPIWFINTVGLQQSVIDSIAVFKYRKDEGLVEGTECSVCLGEFQEDQSLRLLPKCSHAFHVPCIDTWLRSRKNCPLCRAPIVRETSGREVSVVTLPEFNVSVETHVENLDGGVENHHVGEGESSQLRLEDDDSGIRPTGDGLDSKSSDKNLSNSDKMNCHSPRVNRERRILSTENAAIAINWLHLRRKPVSQKPQSQSSALPL